MECFASRAAFKEPCKEPFWYAVHHWRRRQESNLQPFHRRRFSRPLDSHCPLLQICDLRTNREPYYPSNGGLVRVEGFEPPASCAQSTPSTKLTYTRIFGAIGGIRTHTLQFLRLAPHANWATIAYGARCWIRTNDKSFADSPLSPLE